MGWASICSFGNFYPAWQKDSKSFPVTTKHSNRRDALGAKRLAKNPGGDFSHKIEIPGYLTNVLLSVNQELNMTL
jgi:hypothetical protein